ncbi:hypothetical protein Ga0123461_2298 [Mariprofundus aestuarium]|uniref:Uncharacterized protein n=1 Tax=Mariprofundus aestuarium TaxID=1921086 RepID=A0A2K8L399_MARES|nr:effector-associated domain EAD1-containing protein [Mariprofundus aestuarium]ATX80699.1 hypothetical protein Ga0123461_2298 [Mariprofundus aestuarium]
MIIHQAIYGDKSGAYALLKTSLTDTAAAKRICNVTDLLDRPSNGHLAQPVFRGFSFDNLYIFVKSFPDNDPTVRNGRVLSHTLIVSQDDLHRLNDLEKLFSHFMPELDKAFEPMPIEIDDAPPNRIKTIDHISREAAGINGLLHDLKQNNTLLWIGEEEYVSFISQIWSRLDGSLRATVRLGVGFNPQKVTSEHISVLYVPESYANKWQATDYCVIGKNESGTLEGMASFHLAGHETKAKPLCDLIRTFRLEVTKIEDFVFLTAAAKTYKGLAISTDLILLIALCDLISKYSPNPNIAKKGKKELLCVLLSRVESASAKQIMMINHANWLGFSNAGQLIGEKLTAWSAGSLTSPQSDDLIPELISTAFDQDNKNHWWKKSISKALNNVLGNWKTTYAETLWNWFSKDVDLVKTLGELIPDSVQAEEDFVSHMRQLEPQLAQNLQMFAKNRKWLTLHGLSTLQISSPKESIKRQLKIDIDPSNSAALKRMADQILDKEFLQLTLEIGESRLVRIAASKLVRTPSLTSSINVKDEVWQKIWRESIDQGLHPWMGIKEPMKVLYSLFDEVIKGNEIEPSLLLRLSASEYNDLSCFKKRAEVWKNLNGGAKLGFLNASSLGCVRRLNNNSITIESIEKEVQHQLSCSATIAHVIADNNIKTSTKMMLFEKLPALQEKEIIILLNTVRFSSEESKRLGSLVSRNYWKSAAKAIANKTPSRADLKPALIECRLLLSFFEKLNLSHLWGFSESFSKEEWWKALEEQCYSKYSSGPKQSGLWERAGGENYDLQSTGSGREIWLDAIKKIRSGSTHVNGANLIHEMLNDYHSSPELKQLKQTVGEL